MVDVSQLGNNALQTAQWQSLLSALDPAGTAQSGAVSGSDPFAALLQSAQSTSSGDPATGSNSMAMLQALQGYGTTSNSDSLLQMLDGTGSTDSSDPLLQAFGGTSSTSTEDPLLQALDSADGTTDTTDSMGSLFDSNLALTEAMQGIQNPSAGGTANSADSISNTFAMLQALNNNNSSLLQSTLGS